MLNLERIKEKFSSMETDELIIYAQEEQEKLVFEAFKILEEELKGRNVDTDEVLSKGLKKWDKHGKYIVNSKALENLIQQSRKGKSIDELMEQIILPNEVPLEEELVRNICPVHSKINDEHLKLFSERITNYNSNTFIHYMRFLPLPVIVFVFGFRFESIFVLILGLLLSIGLLIYIAKDKRIKSRDHWLDELNDRPENFVWLLPVHTTYQMNFVKYAEQNDFELRNRQGEFFRMHYDEDEVPFYMDFLKKNMPHLHVGFDKEVEEIYKNNSEQFLGVLLTEGKYQPIGREDH